MIDHKKIIFRYRAFGRGGGARGGTQLLQHCFYYDFFIECINWDFEARIAKSLLDFFHNRDTYYRKRDILSCWIWTSVLRDSSSEIVLFIRDWIAIFNWKYSVTQSYVNSFWWDVVLDTFNNVFRDEDNILYQIWIK